MLKLKQGEWLSIATKIGYRKTLLSQKCIWYSVDFFGYFGYVVSTLDPKLIATKVDWHKNLSLKKMTSAKTAMKIIEVTEKATCSWSYSKAISFTIPWTETSNLTKREQYFAEKSHQNRKFYKE